MEDNVDLEIDPEYYETDQSTDEEEAPDEEASELTVALMSSLNMNPMQECSPVQNEESNLSLKTGDVYAVDPNLPRRFNNPECFQGYSKKVIHPFYWTTNQTYGGRKPTVHEMPTAFHGNNSRFTEHLLKSGVFRDTCLNTYMDTDRVKLPSAHIESQDRIRFHQFHLQYRSGQTVHSSEQNLQNQNSGDMGFSRTALNH
ncbi:hypothetical protein GJAV_G00029110 [Gymnothorax javanicus]|nr:hypothetical protein GJAV_G00029110 [Gymnothorax javanicus]